MSRLFVPKEYRSKLNLFETEDAIALIKRNFQNNLGNALNLQRISAPLFVFPESGLNDDLNGVERAVAFDIKDIHSQTAQIVHSLAKWKRMALYRYGFPVGKGLYTDMNAIRRDEELDNLHSIYVDQWDWEKVIDREHRNVETLKDTVRTIVKTICKTLEEVKEVFPAITLTLSDEVYFITTQALEDRYPDLSPKERENAIAKEHRTVFIMQIGDKLKSGIPHDGRAPDYDDWSLNGDIIVYNDLLESAFEISSMGIRVDAKSLDEQLKKSNCNDRRHLPFHKLLLEDKLPLTIGGGIGQSRLCMLLLEKAHIGEIHVSLWDDKTHEGCEKAGITLL